MRVNTLSLLRLVAAPALLTAACDSGTATRDGVAAAPAPAAGTTATAPVAGPSAPATPTLARLRDDVPLPLTKLLARPLPEVEAELGEPLGKGMQRDSCVRLVPERVFFACSYSMVRYADKTGNFKEVRVGYEDGVSTEVAYDGWKHGSGEFTSEALLAAVGLSLPEPVVATTPAPNVQLWSWFNHQARLLHAGGQYRVEVSVVEGDWARSRVEVMLNDRLTPEQQARVHTSKAPQVSEPPAP